MKYIEQLSSENTGGGCWVDFVHLANGQVIGVNDECAVLYESIEDFWECSTKDRPSFEIAWNKKRLSAVQIKDLAEIAANEAIKQIQDKLGVKSGDFAGLYFSGDERWSQITNALVDYVRAEISEGGAK